MGPKPPRRTTSCTFSITDGTSKSEPEVYRAAARTSLGCNARIDKQALLPTISLCSAADRAQHSVWRSIRIGVYDQRSHTCLHPEERHSSDNEDNDNECENGEEIENRIRGDNETMAKTHTHKRGSSAEFFMGPKREIWKRHPSEDNIDITVSIRSHMVAPSTYNCPPLCLEQ